MEFIKTDFEELVLIKPNVYSDDRGYFYEFFNESNSSFKSNELNFVQDNISQSTQGTLRGLHFQKFHPQGKLVTCLQGSVLDVVVDIDIQSPTFGKHFSVELSDSNHLMLWVPPSFAHGFYVLSKEAVFLYKCTDHYNKLDESGIIWNDEYLNINWPTLTPTLSEKDSVLPSFKRATSFMENI
ncbi:dTDP-4-dehydrorhamnose 3,5-epimerase [Gammaproteobacteria bacterium]|jgi:dTDP-4-dehydrorhamnose 3,5-epimerase|nr:dTDP-4-dehydrorhamnose 3,5-epimerase [Gammaproteobacteria bacterium]MDC0129002.1 dTDP-4-dehydrorhamnose 3,5-epimerase [Gammaproteobacteria bacterium]